MTNGMDMLPPSCSCKGGGADLIPLLVVVGVFVGVHLMSKLLKQQKGKEDMKTGKNVAIIAIVVVAAAAVLIAKNAGKKETVASTPAAVEVAGSTAEPASQGKAIPRLVDLGAGKCILCKMMAPILEELKKEYASTFAVEFIDVWENPKAGERYGIRMIPTQIFYDNSGKELFRHEGFFGKEEILAKWKEYGVAASTKSGE